jgi:O-antigen ligase
MKILSLKQNYILLGAFFALFFGTLIFFWSAGSFLASLFLLFLVLAWQKVELAFFVLVAYLPFQVALNPAAGIDLASGRLLSLALFLLLVARVFKKKEKVFLFFKNRTFLFSGLFLLLATLSVFWAVEPFWAARKVLFFLSLSPLCFLTAFFVWNKKEEEQLSFIVVCSSALSALLGLVQFFAQFVFDRDALVFFWLKNIAPFFSGASLSSLIETNSSWLVEALGSVFFRVVGLFPDPHMMSFYLGMTLPFALALLFFGNKYKRWLFVACFLILAAIFLTFSRGGYLGVLASLVFFFIFAWPKFERQDKKFLFGCFLLLVVFLLFFSPIFGRLTSIFSLDDGSNLGRLAIWQESLRLSTDNLLFGAGLGGYSFLVDFSQNYRNAMTSHNLYLDLFVELGLVGLASFLFLIFFVWRIILRGYRAGSFLSLPLGASLVYFLVHSFFETAIFNPIVLSFLMIYLGLVAKIEKDVYPA